MSAAIYSTRKKIKTLIISKDMGGQAALSSDVENYLGFHMITGAKLAQKFETHLRDFEDIELVRGEEVSAIKKKSKKFIVQTLGGKAYEGKTVLITSGKVPRKLGIPGEEKYRGRGVTYCATCDAPLFSGKDVAVIGGGNAALDAAWQLTKIAKSIQLVTNGEHFKKADQVLFGKIRESKKVTIYYHVTTSRIDGDAFVQSMEIKNAKTEKFHVQGVFIEIGSIPATQYLNNFIKLNQWQEIVINERNETSVKGVYAAGDVTSVPEKQVIVAAGEGAKAALMEFDYLAKRKA